MDDEDFGNDRDPLLVRPFLKQDDAPGAHTTSKATWPAGSASDSATQVLPVFPGSTESEPRPPRRKRRPLLVAGIGAGALTVLAVAGYTAFRPDADASFTEGLPGPSFPVVTGPASPSASVDTAGNGDSDSDTESGGGTGNRTPGTSSTSKTAGSLKPVPANSATTTASGAASAQPNAPAVAPSPPKFGTGTLVSGNGLCLDLTNAIPIDGNSIQVFDCNQSAAQVWTLADDGTLRVMGKCALLVGDDTVHLTGCDRRTTALWRVGDGRTLINAANDRCLTDPSSGARPRTTVVVVRCTGAANQSWTLK